MLTQRIQHFGRLLALGGLMSALFSGPALAMEPLTVTEKTADLDIQAASVQYRPDLDLLVFQQEVAGRAGGTVPEAKGQLDGAPVLGYVFPTTLSPDDVGFDGAPGIVALAVTSHPDFDDTPLWDENQDRNYENDGRVYHTHWVVLTKDERVPGGLSVLEFKKEDEAVVLPPTAPGLPMYMDSPGHAVVERGRTLKVLVPARRIHQKTDFSFDAVSVYMQVNTSDSSKPMLGVYHVYDVLSGDLSLPYTVKK